MKTQFKEEEIKDILISLIECDIIHNKLIYRFITIGIDASEFFTNLGDEVFQLVGFIQDIESEPIYTMYHRLVKKGEKILISDNYRF